MLLVRAVLLIVFGLLSLAVLVMMVQSPTANLAADATMLGLFVLVILVLGPWWPNPDKPRNWDWALKFDLPTDDPKIAAPLGALAMGIYSLFHAWGRIPRNAKKAPQQRLAGAFASRSSRVGDGVASRR